MAADEDLMTVAEAAQRAGVSPERVYHWIHRGKLTSQRGRYGQLVSLAAVRALAETPVPPRSPREPREVPGDEAEYVTPTAGARLTGLRRARVSNWARVGMVATKPGPYGRLVRLVDVQALAAQT